MRKTLKNWLIVIVVLSCLFAIVCIPGSADESKSERVRIFPDIEDEPIYYGDTVTLKASVIDVDVPYTIIWEVSYEDDIWEVVGTGKMYQFVMDHETATYAYRATVIAE